MSEESKRMIHPEDGSEKKGSYQPREGYQPQDSNQDNSPQNSLPDLPEGGSGQSSGSDSNDNGGDSE